MCCNGTLHQKHKHPKRKHFQLNHSSIFSTWHLAVSDIISHLMLKSQQPAIIPKIARYPSKRSYHFQPNPSNTCWMSSPVVWNHPTDLICFCPKQTKMWQLSQDSCHSFSLIAKIAFSEQLWQLFRIAVTAFLEQLWQLTQQLKHYWFFLIWLKPKPTIETTFLLLKYLPFLLLFP